MTKEVTIRLTGDDQLELFFPGAGDGHHVTIPTTPAGFRALESILRYRRNARPRDRTIGTNASPVQSMVEEWLRLNKVSKEEIDLEGIDL